jgi:hypothetical protein
MNGLRFGVEFRLRDLTFFYRISFYVAAWTIGYIALAAPERIVTSRVAILALGTVAALAVAYFFLPYGERLRLLSYFQPVTDDLARQCRSDRLPGLNQPVNIYSFVPLVFLLFSMNAFLEKKASVLVPALSMVVILALASRLTLSTAVMILAASFQMRRGAPSLDREVGRRGRSTKRGAPSIIFALTILMVLVFTASTQWGVGERVVEKLTAVETQGATRYRMHKWHIGMKRVAMAPVLGIPEPFGRENEELGYLLTMDAPHNEFVQIWMWYGLLGFLAHVILLIGLVRENLRYRTGAVWLLFYLTVVLRMMADTAFKSFQFSAVFFMVAGYNWRVLEQLKAARSRFSR